MKPKTTLDQWLVLKAVIEQGGFSQAAEFLNRSQSTVSYAVAQLQSQLGVKLLQIEGRKAVLTPVGKILFHRATLLLDSANAIEKIAQDSNQGWPAEMVIVVDDPFPRSVLANALKKFMCFEKTRIQIYEVSLSGALEALNEGKADIVTAYSVPKGYMEFCQAQIIQVAVAHRDHPLHHLAYDITAEDLKKYVQFVVRDSAKFQSVDKGFLDPPQRLTVTSSQLAIDLLQQGIGFAWMPLHYLTNLNTLKPLPLKMSQTRNFYLNLLFGRKTPPNQAMLSFADCLKAALQDYHCDLASNLNRYLSQ